MQRRIVGFLTVVGVLGAVAGVALGAGTTNQALDASVTPSRLPSDKPTGVSLKISETTGTTDPSGVQPPTASAKIFLDKDIAINTKGLPQCNITDLMGKTTAQAKAVCGSARVGSGSAVARISNGAGGHIDLHGVVTAFNGNPLSHMGNVGCQPVKTRPCLYLHVLIGSAPIDVILEITKGAGSYRTKLSTLPGASEPIRNLTLSLKRGYKFHGKHQDYVSARCSHQKLLFKGKFTYDGSPPKTVTDSQPCRARN